MALCFHNLSGRAEVESSGITWPFYPLQSPYAVSLLTPPSNHHGDKLTLFLWSRCSSVAFLFIALWLEPPWVHLQSVNGQLKPFLRLLVDILPVCRAAPRGGLGLCSKEETCASFPIVHQLSLGLSIPATTSETASPFLVSSNQRMDGRPSSAWPFLLVSKTGNSRLFLFQFHGFFCFPTGQLGRAITGKAWTFVFI